MKPTVEVRDGKGWITISDPTGKYAEYRVMVDESDPAKVTERAESDAKRVGELYDAYEKMVRPLLNKKLVSGKK